MDSQEFKEELINYITSSYNVFCGYQAITRGILIELDRICQIGGINYYLAYGTLLGAVRDKCQIPWDYDIDTFVKIDDKVALLQLLEKELGNDYYYEFSSNSKTYPTSCLRVCRKGFSMMALHVDVFFLVGTPNDERERKRFIKKTERCLDLRTAKYLNYYLNNNKEMTFIHKCYRSIVQALYHLIPDTYLRHLEKQVEYKYPLKDSEYWFSMQRVYSKLYPRRIFDEVIRIPVEDFYFSIPSGYEEFLSINYRNWQSYLPIKNRFEEFYNMKNVVEERQESYINNKKR